MKALPYDLIISDVDGTLIQDYEKGFDPRLFDLIRRLHARGVTFCVASGRQYVNLRAIFSEVFDITHFIAENGGCVFYQDILEDATGMSRPEALALAAAMQSHPVAECMISAPLKGYIRHPSPAFGKAMEVLTNWAVDLVEAWEEAEGPILKVSAFVPHSVEQVYQDLLPHAGPFKGAISGEYWIDFTEGTKGLAASKLCQKLGISPTRVLAFGDQFNDLSLFDFTPHAYAMPQSPATVQARAGLGVCKDICACLEQLLEEA